MSSLAAGTAGAIPNAERQTERKADRRAERPTERRLERPAQTIMTDDGRFSLDLAKIPPGYVMEWKRHTIMGAEDRRNQVVVRSYHWEPVSHKMQPHIYGHLCENENEHIMVDGLGLYMRPRYLNDDAAKETRDNSDYTLSQQLQALRLQSADQVGVKNTYVKRQLVQAPQPVE